MKHVWPYLSLLVRVVAAWLVIMPVYALAQDASAVPSIVAGIDGDDLTKAATAAALTLAIIWKLLNLLELFIREKIGKPADASAAGTTSAATDALSTLASTVMADRAAVLAAAKETEGLYKALAAADNDGVPRVLAYQRTVLLNQRDILTELQEQREARAAALAAQTASTAATTALVTVLRDMLAARGVVDARP